MAETVNDILAKDTVNNLLDELAKVEIKDMAVVYRDTEDRLLTRWIGDTLALETMARTLTEDIHDSSIIIEEDE
jgi:hypothetical protein